jgi:protein-tyrosine-phosphatase
MLGIRTRLRRFFLEGPARRVHARTLQSFRDAGKPPQNILFLCYGNICRSPVAEKLGQKCMPAARVTSAGFYAEENRRSPSNVQRAAQALGLDLSSWASRRVDQVLVDAADLIVLHDLKNFRDFRREFPNDLHKIMLLGMLLDPPQNDITDPYGKTDVETLEILRQIEASIQALAHQFS